MTREPLTLSLDIGGSHVTAGLIDPARRALIRTARREISHAAPLADLLETWAEAGLEAAQDAANGITGLGVAVPGPFDPHTGTSHMQHKFPALLGLPLHGPLRAALALPCGAALPIRFGNDADLFTLGEWWADPAPSVRRVIGLTIGTGLGAGFVLNGAVQLGGPGVPPDGELWNLPAFPGVLEDRISGRALTHLGERHTGLERSAAQWAEAAQTGDGQAQAVWRAFGEQLGDLLQPTVRAFQADTLILGGNVSRAFDLFAPSIQLSACHVRRSVLFEHAPLLGAAALHAGAAQPA